MTVRDRLFALSDEKYADFQAKLTPTIDRKTMIGVRVPAARNLAKELYRSGAYADFLRELPHAYYDENMLHGLILSECKDYDACVSLVDDFLPHVDNWAVCDIMSPKCFKKNKDRILPKIVGWSASGATYTSRFGIEMLMTHFLDADFKPDYLAIPAGVRLEDYYARMMVAWFFATALTKQWDATLPYIEENRLEPWTHNKAIQKATESYRISDDRKAYLRTLKR